MHTNVSFNCGDNYNVSGQLSYDIDREDGGIPENLALNVAIWLIILIVFSFLRKWAWNYGRLALVQNENEGWTKIFYAHGADSSESLSSQEAINTAIEPQHRDKGYFNWILVVFRLTDDDIKHKVGHDAIHYLGFQKCLIFYTVVICLLSIVVILPVNHSGDNIPERNHYGTTTMSNIAPDSNVIWLHTIFAFLYLVILVVMLWKFSQGYETDLDPVSQLTVLVSHVSKSATQDQLKQHLEEVYGDGNVNSVQLVYDIDELIVINRKLVAACLGRGLHAEHLMRFGAKRDTRVSTSTLCPCCPHWKVKHDGLEYFGQEVERNKDDFAREKEAVWRFKNIGLAFVTFARPSIVVRCIKDYSRLLGGSYTETSMSTLVKSQAWNVERAPPPGNVIWENLSTDPKYWWLRTALINILLFLFVLFFTTPAILITSWNHIKSSVDKKAESEGNPLVDQFLPTLLLWIFAAILPSVVSWSSYYEYQWTRTQQEKSVMSKVYIFLLFMIIILPSLALTSLDALFEMTFGGDVQSFKERMRCVFLPNNGAFFVNYVITAALIGTALELLRVPELIVYAVRICYTKNEGERLLVKKEAVIEFPFGIQYAWMIAIHSITISYSIACPLVVPFGLLYLLLKHFVDRYNLYFNYRPPSCKSMDRSVHNTAVYFVIISTYLLLFCILFYSVIRLGIQDPQTIFALVIFLLAVVLFIGKVCFGWFSKYNIYRRPPSVETQERVMPDSQVPEAYLPPVLQSTYRIGELSEEEQKTILRRRHYGAHDHVIDSGHFHHSDDVVINVPVEPTETN